MISFDQLRKAWQSQCVKPLDIEPRHRLNMARIERRVHLAAEWFVILILSYCGVWMAGRIRDIHEDWPWLIYSACIAWVVGFMLFHQWRRRRHAPRYDEPMLVHVEWAIRDIEYRMWQDRHTFWWYTLPLALGCMIPTVLDFGMKFHKTHDGKFLWSMLFFLAFFAAVFAFVHWAIMRGLRLGREARRHELEVLRSLRASLLNTEEPPP